MDHVHSLISLSEITLVSAILAALAMVSLTALRGWSGWLALKHRELELLGQQHAGAHGREEACHQPSAASRIEIADLKERIRKLEAIAAGVDL